MGNTVASVFIRFNARTRGAERDIDHLARRLRSLRQVSVAAGMAIALSSGVAAVGIAGIGVAAAATALAVGALAVAGTAGLMALAIAAHASSEKVKTAFSDMASTITNDFREETAEWEGLLVDLAHHVTHAWKKIKADVGSIFTQLGDIFERGMTKFFEGGGPETFMKHFKKSFENAVPFLNVFADNLVNITDGIGRFFSLISGGLSGGLAAGFVGFFTEVLPSLGMLMNALMGLAEQALPAVNGMLSGLFEKLAEITRDLKNSGFIEDFFAGLTDGLNAVLDGVGTLMRVLGPGLGDVFRGLGEILKSLAEGPLVGIGKAFENLVDAIVAVVDAAGPLINEFVNLAVDMLVALSGPFSDFIILIAPPLLEFFRVLLEAVRPLIPVIAELAAVFLEVLGGAIADLLDKVTTWMTENEELVQQFAKLIIGAFVIAKTLGLVMGAVSLLGAAFGMLTSPLTLVGILIAGLVVLFTDLWRENETFRVAVTTAWEAISAAVGTAIETIRTIITEVWTWLQEFWAQNGEAIVTKVQEDWNEISGKISETINLVRDILSEVWASIVTMWEEHGEMIWTEVQETFTAVYETVDSIINDVLDVINYVLEGIAVIWDEWGDEIMTVVSFAFGMIMDFIQMAAGVISGIITALTGFITGDIEKMKDGVLRIVGALVEYVKSKFTKMKDVVVDLARKLKDRIIEKIVDLAGDMTRRVSETWRNIKQTFSRGVSDAVEKVASLATKIVNAIKNPGDLLKSIGRKIVRGFINGVTEMFDDVKATFGNLTSMLPDWKGPPEKDRKLLRGAGELVLQGFIDGLNSQADAIKKTLLAVTQMMPDALGAEITSNVRGTLAAAPGPQGLSGSAPGGSGGGGNGPMRPIDLRIDLKEQISKVVRIIQTEDGEFQVQELGAM